MHACTGKSDSIKADLLIYIKTCMPYALRGFIFTCRYSGISFKAKTTENSAYSLSFAQYPGFGRHRSFPECSLSSVMSALLAAVFFFPASADKFSRHMNDSGIKDLMTIFIFNIYKLPRRENMQFTNSEIELNMFFYCIKPPNMIK